MKKVLLITYYFNLRDTDRAYTAYSYFKNRSFDITVIAGNFDHNSKTSVKYNLDDVIEVSVRPYYKNASVERIRSFVEFGFEAKKLIKNMNFDIAYVVGPPNSTGYILRKIIREKKAFFVSDIYDLYPETIPLSPWKKKILNFAGFWFWSYLRDKTIKDSDCFVGSCHYYFTRLKLSEDSKHHMIPLCKGEKQIQTVEKRSYESIRIIYLGALTGNYDFEGLVDLMTELKRIGGKACLDIVGEGPRKEWLLKSLDEAGIDYKFYGRIYDDETKKMIMRNCHFGFNGFKDGAAIALSYKSMEYLSNGLALINSCKEDTWNLVEKEKIGFNYNANDINLLARSLVNSTSEEVYEMQKRALAVYDANYARHNYTQKMDEIFLNEGM